jgi:hypothetical protein
MTKVASCARSVNDPHYALLRHLLRSPRPHVAVTSECCARVTSRFSLLAPYPTDRIDVILHQYVCSARFGCFLWFFDVVFTVVLFRYNLNIFNIVRTVHVTLV